MEPPNRVTVYHETRWELVCSLSPASPPAHWLLHPQRDEQVVLGRSRTGASRSRSIPSPHRGGPRDQQQPFRGSSALKVGGCDAPGALDG